MKRQVDVVRLRLVITSRHANGPGCQWVFRAKGAPPSAKSKLLPSPRQKHVRMAAGLEGAGAPGPRSTALACHPLHCTCNCMVSPGPLKVRITPQAAAVCVGIICSPSFVLCFELPLLGNLGAEQGGKLLSRSGEARSCGSGLAGFTKRATNEDEKSP